MIQMHPRQSLAVANRALLAAGLILGGLFTTLAVKFGLSTAHIIQLKKEMRQLETQVKRSQETVDKAKSKSQTEGNEGISAVPRVQASLQQAAQQRNVEIREFRTSTTYTPYLNRFVKDSPNSDWFQVDCKAVLVGELSGIMSCLQQLCQSNGLLEFDNLEFNRESALKGKTLVSTAVSFRVLTKLKGQR